MKIALKYGLLITAVVVAWIVIVRLVMGVGADSKTGDLHQSASSGFHRLRRGKVNHALIEL